MADEVSSTSDVALYFLAIFIPPLAVFFKRGLGSGSLFRAMTGSALTEPSLNVRFLDQHPSLDPGVDTRRYTCLVCHLQERRYYVNALAAFDLGFRTRTLMLYQ
ncbi:hypothetical protein GSI_10469 [Ganoderma sinense ZZ0214-1]|uniref:Uncharacterized protein n=1 Tax=Ganoderma sinense ZZ0214-1 TaxID=1077348 RepID=A0A2G8S0M3_9APHY|nr:hypothetical protein GSI_10469 [Ganoderma sinense ZZ0214-1]